MPDFLHYFRIGVSSAAIAVAVLGGTAMAAVAAPAVEPDASGRLEEIVVTAQKRSENLQKVPISVTAITNNILTQANISSSIQLEAVTPGLVTYQAGQSFEPYIRGVGSNLTSAGQEPSVATYIDGVYVSSKGAAVFDLSTIERIEVLKGPQGTLFGRNATGGAINIVTVAPTSTLTGSGEAGFARFNERLFKAALSGPLTSTLGFSLSGSYREDDGYIHDIVGGGTVGNNKSHAVLGKLVWEPSSAFTAEASVLQEKTFNNAAILSHNTPGAGSLVLPGTINATGTYESSFGFVPIISTEALLARLKLRYGLSDTIDLVSISAYQDSRTRATVDGDKTSAPLQYINLFEYDQSFSQEVQVVSTGAGPFKWIVGGYYYNDHATDEPIEIGSGLPINPLPAQITSTPNTPPFALRFRARLPTEAFAGFAQGTYTLAERDELTVGARYSQERKELHNQLSFLFPGTGIETNVPNASSNTSTTFRKLTYRFAYDHKFGSDILAYASYDRGFKSGGFGLTDLPSAAGQPKPVNPEVLDALEIGVKTELADRTIRLNLAGFYYDYKNIQVQALNDVGVITVTNAGGADIYGIDLDLTVAPTSQLQFRAGLNYLHSTYKDFDKAAVYFPKSGGGASQLIVNANGADTVFAPKFTASLGVTYDIPLDNGAKIVLSGSYYYNDGFDTQPTKTLASISSWSDLGLSVTWHARGERYFFRVWGDNLTNDKHPIYESVNGFGFSETYAKPITYGGTVGFKF